MMPQICLGGTQLAQMVRHVSVRSEGCVLRADVSERAEIVEESHEYLLVLPLFIFVVSTRLP